MHRTEPLLQGGTPLLRNPSRLILLGALALLVGSIAALVVLRPAILQSLLQLGRTSPGELAPWVMPSLVSAAVIGGVALGWLTLSRFVREVRDNPYIWTAPALVLFGAILLGRTGAELPLRVDIQQYAVLSAPLILSGGAFLRTYGLWPKLFGLLLWAAPLSFVLVGHTLRSGDLWTAMAQSGTPTHFAVFVLSLTTLGTGWLALMTRERNPRAATPEIDPHDYAQHQQALEQERVALAQERAALQQAQSRLDAWAGEVAQERALTRRGLHPAIKASLALLVISGSAVAFHFGYHLPVQQRLSASEARLAQAAALHEQQLTAERSRLGAAHRAELASLTELKLAAERSKAQAEAALAAALEAPKGAAPEVEPKAPPKPKAATRTGRARAKGSAKTSRLKRPKSRTRPASKPSTGDGLPDPGGDDPLGGLEL